MIKQVSFPLQPSGGGNGPGKKIIAAILVLAILGWQVHLAYKAKKESDLAESESENSENTNQSNNGPNS